ncbi:hypothetical protein Pan216_28200 [Planctomycetes bacterium Pan216]|uniref:Uncharacterized protein n=1 Tax=Kolteria novifilia TaxID=2527975 RepID=A0A518B4R6_9BACT|nr:hypothetical protein Pan216_28200 [Planctomycetes bacterium Pan216]
MFQSDVAHGPAAIASSEQLLSRLDLSSKARDLLAGTESLDAYLESLVVAELYVDALGLLSYGLPIRRAVWWACLATWHGLGGKPLASDQVLQSAVVWVIAPTPATQSEAARLATMDQLETAAGFCAFAASKAGVIPRRGEPFTAQDATGAAGLVRSAVITAFAKGAEAGREITYRQMIDIAWDIAEGKALWYPWPREETAA